MSGAIDSMTADDTALLEQMRNDEGATEVETVDQESASEGLEPESATEEEPRQRKKGVVPQGALHEERERRKAAEARAVELEKTQAATNARFEERWNLLMEAAKQAQQPVAAPAPEIPDINTDPVGHFRARLEVAEKRAEDRDAILRGFQHGQQQAQQAAALRAWGQSQEAEFAAREPAYNDAMNFMLTARKAQLAAAGIVDPMQQMQVINADVTGVALKAHQDGANFGERLYRISESYGFKKPDAKQAVPALDAALDERAARAEEGRANSTTISQSGSPAPRALTPERVANMSEREFAAHVAKLATNPAALRDLLGH